MTDQVNILTPVGRMVQGNPFEAQTTNMTGQPLVDKQGQPRSQYFFAIAIPKTDPEFAAMWTKVQTIAQAGFPGGESGLPTFSWKYTDGDLPEHKDKEGFPGHHILKCTGGFAPKVYQLNGSDYVEVIDPAQLKRGFYIRAYITPRANGSAANPGVYLNPSMVEIVGYGPEIIGGPSGQEVFGGAPVANLPVGASATPVASATPPSPGAPTTPALPGTPAAPTTPALPGTPATPPPAPAPDFLNGPVVVPPTGPGAPTREMTPAAQGATYEQMIAAGWTDETLIAQGMMVPF